MNISHPSYRVALVDDHKFFMEGFQMILNKYESVKVVGTYSTALQLLDDLNTSIPDIIFMDIEMPEMNGIDATKQVLALRPQIMVIAVTQHCDVYTAEKMFKAGAYGYMTKDCTANELDIVFQCIQGGEKYIPADIAIKYAKHSLSSNHVEQQETLEAHSQKFLDKELTIIRFISQGKTDKEIGQKMSISTKTVEAYKKKIMTRMGVGKATQIVATAYELKILP